MSVVRPHKYIFLKMAAVSRSHCVDTILPSNKHGFLKYFLWACEQSYLNEIYKWAKTDLTYPNSLV